MKTVSVLLSTYNGEKYLRPLLDSVIAQKDVNVKLFVRDDGSKDGTWDILKEYAEKKLIILADSERVNWGFSKSFSWLMQNAPKADYYAFCDQDDIWLPNKLINAVSELEKEDQSIPLLFHSSLIVVDKDLKEITRDTHVHYSRPYQNSFYENLIQNNSYGCTIVINNNLREKYLKIPPEQIDFHDYTVTVIASALGKVVFSDDPQIMYRQHSNNTVGFYKGSLRNVIRTLKFSLKNDCKNNKIKQTLLLKKYFYDELPAEYKDFVEKLSDYKNKKNKKEVKKIIKNNVKEKFIKNYNLFLIRFNKF